MTRRYRQSSSESVSYSSTTRPRYRRRTPTKEESNDDEYEDADNSNSQGEEAEQDVEDEDVAVLESVSNTTPPSDTYIPETPSLSSSELPNPSPSNSSSYVQIAPLPIFRGTPSESPVTHLSRFNKVCRANNASSTHMQMRIFPVTLEDEAALWYDLNVEPYYDSLSWEETKLSFLEAYYSVEPVEELRSELVGMRQGESETVRSYFLRLQWLLKRWPEHGLGEDVLKGVFVDGLRQDFREWVLIHKGDSLNDALRLAFEFEKRRVRGEKEVGSTFEMAEGGHGSVKKKQCHKCGKEKVLRNSSCLQSRLSRSPSH